MTNTIRIFDPNDKPFGWLSNNYTHLMEINRKRWKTVTNYIYANILTYPMYVQEVQMTKNPKDVQTTFARLYQEEIDDITRKAIEKALTVKFNNNEMAEKLLATGNSDIFYISSNQLLGVGIESNGKNIYGKYLMQTRHNLQKTTLKHKQEAVKTKKEQNIYDTYLANMALIDAIRQGENISEFNNKTPEEIVTFFGRENLEKKAPNKEIVLDMERKKRFNEDLVIAIDHPETLVPMVLKREIRKLRLRKIKQQKEIIFDMYADYLLEKHFSNLDPDKYSQAKEQQFQQMGWQQKHNLENRLYDLFEKNMLSKRLSKSIDVYMAHHYIPSIEEVEIAENYTYQLQDDNPETNLGDESKLYEKGQPVLVYPTDLYFSPISFTGMLNIDNQFFPTVLHYITTRLIAHIPPEKGGGGFGGMEKAYKEILANPNDYVKGTESFINPDDAYSKYIQLRDYSYMINLQKYAKEALDKKFEDRFLQDILLLTGKSKLVYNDFSNPILGVGGKQDKGGMNFVGKYLMELRNNYNKERKNETLQRLQPEDVSNLLNEDPFMKEWLNMRVRDMCKVLMTMKNYLYSKDKIDVKINSVFTSTVLDKIYQPCSQVFGATKLVTSQAPEYFIFMVKRCKGFEQVNREVVDVMWKRIAVIIYYLIKYMKDTNIRNIRVILARTEQLVTNSRECVYIIQNSKDNCIVSALVNLLRGIIEFNKQFSYSTDVTETDVKTAASIILNFDISKGDKIHKPEQKDDDDDESKIYEEEQEDILRRDYEKDDDDDEGEIDYGDEEDENEDEEREGWNLEYSPYKNMIVSVLEEFSEVRDPEAIAIAIEDALEIIKRHRMSDQIKRNRINFFATQRS